ncbi:MAG: DUF192 domain-containing protein [Candidatus Krumholzibacteriota bacterium]|nr:DUF192 domain-containing protein [Candidatus Krumholzibacteriota bacterium]
MSVRNRTRRTILGETLLTLNSNFRETLNYLNSAGIPRGCVLWITPCRGIFTVGNNRVVDIAFLDKEGRVVKTLRNFPPNNFADSVPEAVSAIELPSNTLTESKTVLGDLLEFDLS